MGDREETEEITDSPNAWVAEHIRQYLATGGRARPGMNDLLLTTRGRKSGTLRRTALLHVRDGERYVLAASNAGADRHPAWYLNLTANLEVTIQIGREAFPATARTAVPEEKPRLWELIVAAVPSYRDYQEATDREIPMVIVDRAS
ncbi:nitroreductase family deazaflavin-dependent oxidoreductase [Streptomyces cinereoruber]|uniref:nitroreductase family deazaflavin-dependent oxidoreductase n=1 Tax=Streptomyces cinereoruber TaxID=67260 RepID=UPI003C2BF338